MSSDVPPQGRRLDRRRSCLGGAAGQALLGPGRAELLEGIDRLGSISAAARDLRHVVPPGLAAGAEHERGGGRAARRSGDRRPARGRRPADAARPMGRGDLPAVARPAASERGRLRSAVRGSGACGRRRQSGRGPGTVAGGFCRRPAEARAVRCVFGASDELADQLLAGSPADLFLSADDARARPPGRGGADGAGPAHGSGGQHHRRRRPCRRDEAAIRAPTDLLLSQAGRIAVARPSCPLGGYTRTYLTRLGLYEALAPRLLVADNARSVASAVRAGRRRCRPRLWQRRRPGRRLPPPVPCSPAAGPHSLRRRAPAPRGRCGSRPAPSSHSSVRRRSRAAVPPLRLPRPCGSPRRAAEAPALPAARRVVISSRI